MIKNDSETSLSPFANDFIVAGYAIIVILIVLYSADTKKKFSQKMKKLQDKMADF